MRLYKKYNLSDNVDFIDVELSTDNKKWIDPMMMYMDKSQMGIKCCQIVQQYFSGLLELAIAKDDTAGYKYTKYFVEMNETRLGYSVKNPNGLSGGENLGIEIYNLIKESKAIYTEMIGDIFDASVMIEGLGVDKTSDFITSLIFEELIEFTQKECLKYEIPMQDVFIKNRYWSYDKQTWVHNTTKKLPYDEENKMVTITERNYFEKGIEVEVFGPNIETFSFVMPDIYNEENELVEAARHPEEILKFKLDKKVYKNDMIRVKIS